LDRPRGQEGLGTETEVDPGRYPKACLCRACCGCVQGSRMIKKAGSEGKAVPKGVETTVEVKRKALKPLRFRAFSCPRRILRGNYLRSALPQWPIHRHSRVVVSTPVRLFHTFRHRLGSEGALPFSLFPFRRHFSAVSIQQDPAMFILNRPVLRTAHREHDTQDISRPFGALLVIGSCRLLPVPCLFDAVHRFHGLHESSR
jgi:hypothetical protein